jgi:hypothetical protein
MLAFPFSHLQFCPAVVEPNNAVFASMDLWDYMNAVFMIDNEALYNICIAYNLRFTT